MLVPTQPIGRASETEVSSGQEILESAAQVCEHCWRGCVQIPIELLNRATGIATDAMSSIHKSADLRTEFCHVSQFVLIQKCTEIEA